MIRLTGRPAAPGLVIAPAAILRPSCVTKRDRPSGPPANERRRLDAARSLAATELRSLAEQVAQEVGTEEAEIFLAHAAFAEDPELGARAVELIERGASAETAVTEAFTGFRVVLEAADSDYLAVRAADLDDVCGRVLTLLAGGSVEIDVPGGPAVIVAHELSPSQTASIPRQAMAALVTETGSATSHAAILARSLGIPAVVGVAGVVELVEEGASLAVDGGSGEVLVDPSPAAREGLLAQIVAAERRRAHLSQTKGELGRTADGHLIEIAANIGGIRDLESAVAGDAEGTGLVRTEFLYLDRRSAPDVGEQAEFVTRVLRAFPGHRVVIRTLDVGADKPLEFIAREPEANPALGLRGIRLSLASPEHFRQQLRAILRGHAAAGEGGGRLAIMFPLVTVPEELSAARGHLAEIAAAEAHDLTSIEVGVMIETPAAALAAARFAADCDFLSIGTNDLLQYLFAADRLNSEVADLADAASPIALRLIDEVVRSGHAAGAWVGICGEAASDPVLAAGFVGLGIDELSVTGPGIPELKAMLLRLRYDDCRAAVARAMLEPDARGARTVLSEVAVRR